MTTNDTADRTGKAFDASRTPTYGLVFDARPPAGPVDASAG